MTLPVSTLRPGLLVALATSTAGNVNYRTTEIVAEHIDGDGAAHAAWETEKTIQDAAEHDAAIKVRSRATSIVRGVCSRSAKWLLCPEKDRDALDAAVAEAHRIVDAFNSTATVEVISFSVIIGRIAADDVEAVKAINGEVRDLLAQMERGVAKLDPTVIREAATKAKSLSKMLSDDAQERVKDAVAAVRKVAVAIVKAGEDAVVEVDNEVIAKLTATRTAFLDFSDASAMQAPEMTARTVDVGEPSEPEIISASPAASYEELMFPKASARSSQIDF